MNIYLGSDHAGFELKGKIQLFLSMMGHTVEDKGAFTYDPQDDYPDFVRPVAEAVAANPDSFGIVLGGSGDGEAMCANHTPGVRAAMFYGPMLSLAKRETADCPPEDYFEIVTLARVHNNANVLSLGARFLTDEDALEAVRRFIVTDFSGDERHVRRINKLEA